MVHLLADAALRAPLDTRSWVVVDIEPTRARQDWLHVIARPGGHGRSLSR